MERALNIASAVAAVMLLGLFSGWIRSYWIYDQISWGAKGWAWMPYPATHMFSKWPPAAPEGTVGVFLITRGELYLNSYSYSAARLTASHGHAWRSDDNIIPSFSYFYAKTGDMERDGTWRVVQGSVRIWAVVLFVGLLPAVWAVKKRRSPSGSERSGG
jgi:hypothetical protein